MDDYEIDDFQSDIVENEETEDDDVSVTNADEVSESEVEAHDEMDDDIHPIRITRRKPIITKPSEQTMFERVAVIAFRISQLSNYIRGMDTIEQMTYLPKHELDLLLSNFKASQTPYILMKQIAMREYNLGLLSSHMGVTRL